NRKAALDHRVASAPLFPKFVRECAELYHELRKRGTRTLWLVLDLTVRSILPETIRRRSVPISLIFKELRQLVGKFAGFSRYCNRGIAAMHASNERRHGRRLV